MLSRRSDAVRRREREAFAAFCERHSGWLDEFALFMALKETHNNVAWTFWDADLALRKPDAIERARDQLREEIECNKFIQFEFERQWCDLKAHCASNGIRIMGDVPIYVAMDSADVWANRDLFELDEAGSQKWSPASHQTTSAPPANYGAIRSTAGKPTRRLDMHGGSPACAVPWKCST